MGKSLQLPGFLLLQSHHSSATVDDMGPFFGVP